MDAVLFVVAAVALLGSPGPGIAALVVIGRTHGVRGGLPFFTGLQIGLALAAALSAAGLVSVVLAIPVARTVLTVASIFYLLWLAWSIASAPVRDGTDTQARPSFAGGFLVGFANPKAFLSFLSLYASFTILEGRPQGDAVLKWLLCVAVMLAVDLVWLYLGAVLGRIRLGARRERVMNVAMGGTLLAAAGLTLV